MRTLPSPKADFPEDFELEETSLEDVLKEGEVEVEEESEDEKFTDFWLPPGKSLRF